MKNTDTEQYEKLDLRYIISANKILTKYKLTVGIPINLIHKKTKKGKKQLRVNWSASSGVKFTRSGL